MGMQISCGVYPEVPPEGPVYAVATGLGSGVSGFGRAEGMQSGGGAPDARSRAYVVVGAAKVFGGERDGVHQGEKRDPPGASVCRAAQELRGAAFLGARVLGIDGRQERGGCASVYPRAGERRPTPRTTGDDGALSASQSQ